MTFKRNLSVLAKITRKSRELISAQFPKTELPVKIRVQIINEKIENLKADFAEFIKDQSRPLSERWDVFVSANDMLSERVNIDDLPDDVEFVTKAQIQEFLLENNYF